MPWTPRAAESLVCRPALALTAAVPFRLAGFAAAGAAATALEPGGVAAPAQAGDYDMAD